MYYIVNVRMKCNIKCSCAFIDESDTSIPAGDSTRARRTEDVSGLGRSFSYVDSGCQVYMLLLDFCDTDARNVNLGGHTT